MLKNEEAIIILSSLVGRMKEVDIEQEMKKPFYEDFGSVMK